jgi:hypothetical protein
MGAQELAGLPEICRAGGFRSQLRGLADLYALKVQKPTGIWYGRPKVGNVVVKSRSQLRRLGIRSLGGGIWSVNLDSKTRLQAHVIQIGDRCWKTIAIDDPKRDLLQSLRVDRDSFTSNLAWGRASSASIGFGSTRGGDSWELQRIGGPITLTDLFATPLTEPFNITVELRANGDLISQESAWYRVP